MKANEAPEKLYMNWVNYPLEEMQVEYTRTDAFIEKACKWLKSYRQDTPDGIGHVAGIVDDKTIEEFKQAMEE